VDELPKPMTAAQPADRVGATARHPAAATLDDGPVRGARLAQTAFILREDPDLAEGLPADQRELVAEQLRARVLTVHGPSWDPPQFGSRSSYGLLVLDGMLARRLRLRRSSSLELLGGGDILRPWDDTSPWETVAAELEWNVLVPTRMAVLDERITRIIGRWPELNIAFSARLLRRARSAEYLSAVSHLPRVEERLLAMLWHVASRWGRVTPQGVCVPLRLTHHLLGEIVGARRPSVTLGLQRLAVRGLLGRDAAGHYVLTGDPPDALA
jgi:hypothetical protein